MLTLTTQFELHSGVTVHLIDSSRPWNLANAFGGFGGGEDNEARIVVWDDGFNDPKEFEELRKSWESLEVRFDFKVNYYHKLKWLFVQYDPESSDESEDESDFDSDSGESDEQDESDGVPESDNDDESNPPAKKPKLNPKVRLNFSQVYFKSLLIKNLEG